ncbi:hypothetical protein K432DRAFT_422569 [Lepidopterella palustris CBS 459.81]|uniref:Uncharacterized protein n=1 Tax=Lepidopterella palustris CBS 459.81 TaxID=1314670 RepID=A0A8E2JJB3_9PEZI|nr:hypothetical protein K432DRAFT_422569 [Lepidopterella palustris CBS 459.81]
MPELFDILLSDIDEKVLYDEISTRLGSAYLLETPHLRSPHTTVNVHFLYDSGSPHTFLLQEACDKLFGTNPVPPQFFVKINDELVLMNPLNADSHFEHVNLLDADFCGLLKDHY